MFWVKSIWRPNASIHEYQEDESSDITASFHSASLIVRLGPWNQYRPPTPNGNIQPRSEIKVTAAIMIGA